MKKEYAVVGDNRSGMETANADSTVPPDPVDLDKALIDARFRATRMRATLIGGGIIYYYKKNAEGKWVPDGNHKNWGP
jgi:hypothetical protein